MATFTASSVDKAESGMRWDAKAATFQIRPCGEERWKRGNAKGTTRRRSATDSVAGEQEEDPGVRRTQPGREKPVHAVHDSVPEARFIFLPLSPLSPPSSSPSKRSWGGQRSLRECRQIRIVDAMGAKAATFQIRPCGQERWKRGMPRGQLSAGRPPHCVAGRRRESRVRRAASAEGNQCTPCTPLPLRLVLFFCPCRH